VSKETFDIRSTNTTDPSLADEGRTPTWRCAVTKGNNGRIYAYAVEGGFKVESNGFTSFRQDLLGCRRVEIPIEGSRMTAKLVSNGLAALRAKLIADGLAIDDAPAQLAA